MYNEITKKKTICLANYLVSSDGVDVSEKRNEAANDCDDCKGDDDEDDDDHDEDDDEDDDDEDDDDENDEEDEVYDFENTKYSSKENESVEIVNQSVVNDNEEYNGENNDIISKDVENNKDDDFEVDDEISDFEKNTKYSSKENECAVNDDEVYDNDENDDEVYDDDENDDENDYENYYDENDYENDVDNDENDDEVYDIDINYNDENDDEVYDIDINYDDENDEYDKYDDFDEYDDDEKSHVQSYDDNDHSIENSDIDKSIEYQDDEEYCICSICNNDNTNKEGSYNSESTSKNETSNIEGSCNGANNAACLNESTTDSSSKCNKRKSDATTQEHNTKKPKKAERISAISTNSTNTGQIYKEIENEIASLDCKTEEPHTSDDAHSNQSTTYTNQPVQNNEELHESDDAHSNQSTTYTDQPLQHYEELHESDDTQNKYKSLSGTLTQNKPVTTDNSILSPYDTSDKPETPCVNLALSDTSYNMCNPIYNLHDIHLEVPDDTHTTYDSDYIPCTPYIHNSQLNDKLYSTSNVFNVDDLIDIHTHDIFDTNHMDNVNEPYFNGSSHNEPSHNEPSQNESSSDSSECDNTCTKQTYKIYDKLKTKSDILQHLQCIDMLTDQENIIFQYKIKFESGYIVQNNEKWEIEDAKLTKITVKRDISLYKLKTSKDISNNGAIVEKDEDKIYDNKHGMDDIDEKNGIDDIDGNDGIDENNESAIDQFDEIDEIVDMLIDDSDSERGASDCSTNYEYTIDGHKVDEKILNEKILNEEIINERILDKHIINEHVINHGLLDKNVVDKIKIVENTTNEPDINNIISESYMVITSFDSETNTIYKINIQTNHKKKNDCGMFLDVIKNAAIMSQDYYTFAYNLPILTKIIKNIKIHEKTNKETVEEGYEEAVEEGHDGKIEEAVDDKIEETIKDTIEETVEEKLYTSFSLSFTKKQYKHWQEKMIQPDKNIRTYKSTSTYSSKNMMQRKITITNEDNNDCAGALYLRPKIKPFKKNCTKRYEITNKKVFITIKQHKHENYDIKSEEIEYSVDNNTYIFNESTYKNNEDGYEYKIIYRAKNKKICYFRYKYINESSSEAKKRIRREAIHIYNICMLQLEKYINKCILDEKSKQNVYEIQKNMQLSVNNIFECLRNAK
ncbi:hypothetical protein BDAP_001693 [Binucleata daphniae]